MLLQGVALLLCLSSEEVWANKLGQQISYKLSSYSHAIFCPATKCVLEFPTQQVKVGYSCAAQLQPAPISFVSSGETQMFPRL